MPKPNSDEQEPGWRTVNLTNAEERAVSDILPTARGELKYLGTESVSRPEDSEAKLSDGCTLCPVQDYVIIQPMDAFKTASDLVLPEGYEDAASGTEEDFIRKTNQYCLGQVKAVGPGKRRWTSSGEAWLDKPDMQVGGLVMYHRASSTRMEDTEGALVMIRPGGIPMTVEGEAHQVLGGICSGPE